MHLLHTTSVEDPKRHWTPHMFLILDVARLIALNLRSCCQTSSWILTNMGFENGEKSKGGEKGGLKAAKKDLGKSQIAIGISV